MGTSGKAAPRAGISMGNLTENYTPEDSYTHTYNMADSRKSRKTQEIPVNETESVSK